MQILFTTLAFLAGVFLAIQAPINANLALTIGSKPIMAAFISFLVGTVVLLVVAVISCEFSLAIKEVELWKLLGGFLGAFAVFTTTFVAPKLGVVLLFLFVIFGQVMMSFTIDTFGFFGVVKKEISPLKIIGLILFLTGLLLYTYANYKS